MPSSLVRRSARSGWVWILPALLAAILGATAGRAQQAAPSNPPAGAVEEIPSPRRLNAASDSEAGTPGLSLPDALRWTIEHNPQLATLRKQRGIALAGVVIANTYPFNPIFQHFVWGAIGPAPTVTNHVFNEHTTRQDIELFGQGKYRRAMAQAALTRTEWEIAAQELLTAIQMVRAFDTVLYRQDKLRVQEELLSLQEDVMKKVEPLVQQGHLPRTELMLARADLIDARTALGPARNQLVVAWNDLRRLLGMVDEHCSLQGSLEAAFPDLGKVDLVAEAEKRRPDLHGLEEAIKETQAALRLQIANRWGNPSLGPAMEVNETSVAFAGMWLIWSPPIFNTRKGEIMQRQADVGRAMQAARSLGITIHQDVLAALKRLESAAEAVEMYRTKSLPELRKDLEGFDQLFKRGEPGVTLARVIAIRTRLIQTRSAYLDALFELSQARADLAAAVGDPSLTVPLPALAAAPPHPH
ncbi:MAG TPA: TolC family protein [Gemmataceae bacterium]